MTDKNTTHLAGEFLVAGELARRGYPVAITFGNAKSVDIYATSKSGVLQIDAKAGRSKGNWPITENNINKDMFYILVYLQSQKNILENNSSPEYFVISGQEIISKNLIKTWNTRQGIKYSDLNNSQYKERWNKLPPP
jgi:hypothetical protein